MNTNVQRWPVTVVIVLLVAIGLWSLVHYRTPVVHDPRDITTVRKMNEAYAAGDLEAARALAVEEARPRFLPAQVAKGKADFGPLGPITSIVETTGPGAEEHMHTFKVTWQRGTANEWFRIMPDGLVLKWHYDQPVVTQ